MPREHNSDQSLPEESIKYLAPHKVKKIGKSGLSSEGFHGVTSDLVISTFDFGSRAALEGLRLVEVERSGDEEHYRLTDAGLVVAQLVSTQFPDQL